MLVSWGSMGQFLVMASLRERKGSPYFTIRYRDIDSGEWLDRIKANRERVKRTELEKKFAPVSGGEFSSWVPLYLKEQYQKPSSFKRYSIAWTNLNGWLLSEKIRHPREIKYEHASRYMAWRKESVVHNTARLELKFFGSLMSEAIRREYADRNVIAQYRVHKKEAPLKEELTDEDIDKARLLFKRRSSWMQTVFEILLQLGCRFGEARFHKSQIDFQAIQPLIQIEDSKRKPTDPRKMFTVPISKEFAAYLKDLKWEDGYAVPILDGSRNQNFNSVIKEACGATSHSCRVTFITRCHRAGLTEAQVMRLVNHSSTEVHKIYTRLNVGDSSAALSKVVLPLLPLPETP